MVAGYLNKADDQRTKMTGGAPTLHWDSSSWYAMAWEAVLADGVDTIIDSGLRY